MLNHIKSQLEPISSAMKSAKTKLNEMNKQLKTQVSRGKFWYQVYQALAMLSYFSAFNSNRALTTEMTREWMPQWRKSVLQLRPNLGMNSFS